MGMMRRGNREKYEHVRTELGGTRTASGFIKHIQVNVGGYFFNAPVKLGAKLRGDGLRLPIVRSGRYVHALPNGGECVGESVA